MRRCNNSYDVGEYLDFVNWKCRKRLINTLVEECNEDNYGNEMVYNAINKFRLNWMVCRTCTWYITSLTMTFVLIVMGISGAWFNFYCHLKENCVKALSYWPRIISSRKTRLWSVQTLLKLFKQYKVSDTWWSFYGYESDCCLCKMLHYDKTTFQKILMNYPV